ncbi:MAG: hypothetical protein ABIJ45_06605 [Candidatus Zixiibacteriota bacterium]
MGKELILVLFLITSIVSQNIFGTQPSTNMLNIDYKTELLSEPTSVGDIFEVQWTFKLEKAVDSIYQRFLDERFPNMIAKAYLGGNPKLKFISGDSVWWGELEYNKSYTFNAVYQVIEGGHITCAPIVLISKEMYKDSRENRIGRNNGKGFILNIPVEEIPKVFNKDTFESGTRAFIVPDSLIPKDIGRVYLDGKGPDKKLPKRKQYATPANSMILDIDKLNNGDTVNVSIMRDSMFQLDFKEEVEMFYELDNRSNTVIGNKSVFGILILLKEKLENNIIEIRLKDGKTIYLKLRQVWQLNGYFEYDDPFGTNNNPIFGAECDLYELIAGEYVMS